MDSTSLSDTLPLDLAERLLAAAIHALQRQPGRRGPNAWSSRDATDTDSSTNPLHRILCVLGPRRHYPDITLAAFSRCWWVDLDFASAIGDIELLRMMDRLAQAPTDDRGPLQRRPLQWTHAAMDQASKKGFVHVLDWWCKRFGAACWYTEDALTGAAESGHLDALKWWVDRKDSLSCELNNKILLHATLGGHLDISEWWLTHHCNERNALDATFRVPVMDGLVYALIHAIRSNDTEFRMFHWWLAQPFCRAPQVRHLKRVHFTSQLMLQNCIVMHRTTSTAVIERIVDVLDAVDMTLPVNAVASTCAGVLPTDVSTQWLDEHVERVWDVFGTVSISASKVGNLHALKWVAGHSTLEKMDQHQRDKMVLDSFKCAAEAGHVHVLQWWISECPWFEKVRHAIDSQASVLEASRAGHVHVLDWWAAKSTLPFNCSMSTLDAAARGGHVSILNWWVASGKVSQSELRWWMNTVVRVASEHNCVNVLEWWCQQSQVAMSSALAAECMATASRAGSIDALEWWSSTSWFSDLHKHSIAISNSESPRPQVFDWWMESLPFPGHQGAQSDKEDNAAAHSQLFLDLCQSPSTILLSNGVVGDAELLQILEKLAGPVMSSGLSHRRPLQWTSAAMDQASKRGFVEVLDWWYARFGAACWYTEEALTGAAEAGHLDILNWWMDHKPQLPNKFTYKILLRATRGGHANICMWWLDNHLDEAEVDFDYHLPPWAS
ncbi:hypothetical protein BCR44DRAFT_1495229 [Catenaria anguillulae PL171]|uniref:Ankyrin repeat-containing domain protein n=1 Tax=Catenaria anguillulae PL171 TaxID=765915 RepID=A0A1Y2I1E6_9FUNG|nr:hypothetical protein BCR44DRAFT_1495229 [Catenaria anguillulae PL171]